MWEASVARRLKRLLFYTGLYSPLRPYVLYRYAYQFTPPQIIFLCECIEATRNVPGAVAEIGCFRGHTTVFLSKFMQAQRIDK